MLKVTQNIYSFSFYEEKKVGKFSCYDGVLLVVPDNFVVYCTVTGLEGFQPRSQAEQCPK
jgi:hypothetical protein